MVEGAALPRKAIRTVVGTELVHAATAETPSMRVEFLRRQTIGPNYWHFVQPTLTLFWFQENVRRLRATMDGRGVDISFRGNAGLCIIPEGVELEGAFELGDRFDYAAIFINRDRIPAEYRSLATKPALGFRHEALTHGLTALSKELSVRDDLFPLMADGWMLQALGHMGRVTRGIEPLSSNVAGRLAPWQLRRATECIRANLSGNISLEELASACDLSISYFARAFKKSTGVSPHRWLIEIRIDRAKDLLLGSSSSLAEIATACGFSDQSHFSRAFLRATGNTPGAWRREHIGGPQDTLR